MVRADRPVDGHVPTLHPVRAAYTSNFANVKLSVFENRHTLSPATFVFPTDTGPASAWFSEYLGQSVGRQRHPR